MSEATQQPKKKRRWTITYVIARVLAYIVFHTICPVRIHHTERFNRAAPFLVIGNHNSWLDPIAMCYRIHGQQLRFLGKKELVKTKIGKLVLDDLGIIAVDRHNSDMEALRSCLRVLKEGQSLGIFPEGTRHHEGVMQQIESGIAMIAMRSKAPVIPVYFDSKIRPFHLTHMYVGKDIAYDDLLEQGINRETCELFLQRVRDTYAGMVAAPEK